MVHPDVFRKMVLSLEGVVELPHFDRTSFRINNKIFATMHGETRIAMLKFSEVDQSVYSLASPGAIYPVPNKWGKQGATFIELDKVDGEILTDAIQTSYNFVFKKKK